MIRESPPLDGTAAASEFVMFERYRIDFTSESNETD
jgi:hypothetical protein